MADNPQSPSFLGAIFYRLAFAAAACCIAICAVSAILVMFLFVAFSSEPLAFGQNLADGTTNIRIDLTITCHPQQEPPRQRATSPDNQPPEPHAHLPPARLWRSSRAYTSARASQNPLPMPPELPPAQTDNRPLYRWDVVPSPSPYGPYTSIDPLPPARPGDTNSPAFSWRADGPLPPARPDDDETSPPDLSPRRTSQSSLPELEPVPPERVEEEPLPVYERPPEYDDERHSEPAGR